MDSDRLNFVLLTVLGRKYQCTIWAAKYFTKVHSYRNLLPRSTPLDLKAKTHGHARIARVSVSRAILACPYVF